MDGIFCVYIHLIGTRPARKALGDISNRTTNSSAQKSASKKALGQTKLTHNASAAPSTGRRRKAAKVDLENPPDVEKMTPFREKVEGKTFVSRPYLIGMSC